MNAARNIALLAIAFAVATACKAVREPARQAGATTGGASAAAAHPASGSPSADASRAGCAAVAEVLREAARAGGDRSGAIAPPRDTTDKLGDTAERACVVTWSDSAAHALPVRDVYERLEHGGWQRRERLVDASGPGSEALAFSRGGAVCVVSGESDPGDDSDSTYVPAPGFTITATCFADRPDPAPDRR